MLHLWPLPLAPCANLEHMHPLLVLPQHCRAFFALLGHFLRPMERPHNPHAANARLERIQHCRVCRHLVNVCIVVLDHTCLVLAQLHLMHALFANPENIRLLLAQYPRQHATYAAMVNIQLQEVQIQCLHALHVLLEHMLRFLAAHPVLYALQALIRLHWRHSLSFFVRTVQQEPFLLFQEQQLLMCVLLAMLVHTQTFMDHLFVRRVLLGST
jgi:hypothetical protein